MNNHNPIIAISGYGTMGREIEQSARNRNIEVSEKFDIDNLPVKEKNYNFDVVIDFSIPDTAVDNIRLFAEMGKNIVVGVTGWYDKMDEVKNIVVSNGVGLVWGSNFSIGMQMFFRIARFASSLMNKNSGYDIFLHEMHHHRKKDSPSGTAVSLGNIILEEVSNKNTILDDTARDAIKPEQLHISSSRGGEIPGTHTLYLDSFADTIELTHRARNRRGFADGAVEAALWLHGKTGFWSFNEVLDIKWGQK